MKLISHTLVLLLLITFQEGAYSSWLTRLTKYWFREDNFIENWSRDVARVGFRNTALEKLL